jgi:hypothetical protein
MPSRPTSAAATPWRDGLHGRSVPPRSSPASTIGCRATAPAPPPNRHWARPCPTSQNTAKAFGCFLTDGRVEIDSNTVERTIRPIALNRKNALFAGHDAGAENWAVIASLIETCKLNAIEPHAYLTATLTAIVSGHKQSRIDELLPWNHATNRPAGLTRPPETP